MSGAVPPPAVRPLERAARVPRPVCPGCGRCGCGDPAPAPQRAPLRAGVAICGGGGRASPGGGSFHHCEERLRSGAVPSPIARPPGGLLGSATHVPWARVCGCGGPTLSSWPACPVGAACRAGGGGPSPGGVACHRCEGRLVSGAVPPPAARPPERAARVPHPVCPGCGRCGRGDAAPAPQRVPLRAGVARCGGGRGASLGGCRLPLCGASRVRRSPSPGCPPSGRAAGAPDHSSLRACGRGPLPTGCGCGGYGRGDPSPTPQRALLRARFARCGGGMRVTGGGRLLPGCGASGFGRSPDPDLSSVRPCGRGPLPTGCGCGGCGLGDSSPTPQRALLRAVGAA